MEVIPNSASSKNKMLVSLILGSFLANDKQPQDVHQAFSDYRNLIAEKREGLPKSLSHIFESSVFIIDWLLAKGSDAYNFFFDPQDFNIKTQLALAQFGANEITEEIESGIINRADALTFYTKLKELIEEMNAGDKSELYAIFPLLIDDYIKYKRTSTT
jgi:hypothetical protein